MRQNAHIDQEVELANKIRNIMAQIKEQEANTGDAKDLYDQLKTILRVHNNNNNNVRSVLE